MGLKMPKPRKRGETYYYNVDVPTAFREIARGSSCSVEVAGLRTTVKIGGKFQVSLRTKDAAEAKRRFAAVAVQAAQHYDSLRNGPARLTHKQSLAIAGAIRAIWMEVLDEDPGTVEMWKSIASYDARALAGQTNPLVVPTDQTIANDLETRFGPLIDAFALREGLRIDAVSRKALLKHVAKAMSDVAAVNSAKAAGDYGDSGGTDRYPEYSRPSVAPHRASTVGTITFEDVIDRKVKTRAAGKGGKPLSTSAINKFRLAVREFDKHRDDTDILTVTRVAGEAWKDAMLVEGRLSNNTIGQRIVNVGTVWGWAQRQGHIPADTLRNPLHDVEQPEYELRAADEKTFTMDEARTILRASLKETRADLRWLPWLCAYTGARVNELTPLKPDNVFEYEGDWFLRITTKGGRSLKNSYGERRVPIHPDLLKQGFVGWAHGHKSKDQRMFTRGGAGNVSTWLKEIVGIDREGLAPNHAWRHLFEDLCLHCGIPEGAKLYLTGRSGGGSAAMYGKSEAGLPALAKFLNEFPSYLK
ncbi:DUF6538 domain-containing protein [Roseobacter litoralis]|uniref:DUF6538 domain-containing protein n=1 Tax=Roseobacter litoralis TaxID=42443 RepID=UPI002493BD75|nr:DUF6538 domain-containing protein [Roseobacter litoralis]